MAHLRGLAVATALVVACTAQAQTPSLRICPIGDSITESAAGMASWRYYLDQHLTTGGFAFDFVGHNSGVFLGAPLNPGFDQDHESYSGWRVDHMLLDLSWFVADTNPDIALIHLGTNDLLNNQTRQSTVAELGLCIDVLRAQNPNVTVLLAQIIPIAFRDVTFLNSLLPALVASKDTIESRVVLVDHYTPFDLGVHMQPDGLHPNDLGEQLMAQTWFDALKDFMTPNSGAYTKFGFGCAGNSLGVPVIDPIRGQAASLDNPFSVRVENAPVGAAAFGILGFDRAAFYGTPLPLDLTLLGAINCNMFVGPDATFSLSSAGGESFWTISVPDDSALVGGKFLQQVAYLSPTLNDLGLIFSDAGEVTIVQGTP